MWTKFTFKTLAFAVAICSAVLSGAAYASGPKYSVHHLAEPVVSPDMGRIYFYRVSGLLGFGLQPSIEIDGVKVGKSVTSRYIYVDRPPGTYTISTTTEKEETVSVPLVAGQTVYVRFDVSMGLFLGHVSPVIVDSATAADEIKDCHFVEADAPATTANATTPATTATPTPATSAATAPAETTTAPSMATATTQTVPAPATSPTTAPATTTTAPPTAPTTAAPAAATVAPSTGQPAPATPQN
jgi:hypothetical protein